MNRFIVIIHGNSTVICAFMRQYQYILKTLNLLKFCLSVNKAERCSQCSPNKDEIEMGYITKQCPAAAVSGFYHIVALCVCPRKTSRWNRSQVHCEASKSCVFLFSNKQTHLKRLTLPSTTKRCHYYYVHQIIMKK